MALGHLFFQLDLPAHAGSFYKKAKKPPHLRGLFTMVVVDDIAWCRVPPSGSCNDQPEPAVALTPNQTQWSLRPTAQGDSPWRIIFNKAAGCFPIPKIMKCDVFNIFKI